jgi:ApaG protein
MNPHASSYLIDVKVRSIYVAEQSAPETDQYFFAYTVTIRNDGTVPAQLQTRHWIVTDANGRVQEVRGDGVVGQQPRLDPGQLFNYTSGVVLETPVGSMHGSYQMLASDGVKFDAEIAPFSLAIPTLVH